MGASQAVPDSTSPYVVKIQEQYNVQVMFRTRPKLHATLVVVKGCEWEVSQVKEATVLLIHYMCENLAVSNDFILFSSCPFSFLQTRQIIVFPFFLPPSLPFLSILYMNLEKDNFYNSLIPFLIQILLPSNFRLIFKI